jgi:glycosyltransferase involved in cell wall biosynthesis
MVDRLRVFVFGDRRGSRYLAGRTLRSLRARGIDANDITGQTPAVVARGLAAEAGPAWFLRAGAWLARRGPLTPPPTSATGRPVCALGAVLAEPAGTAANAEETKSWAELHAVTGGDFQTAADLTTQLPEPASVYLEGPAVESLAQRLATGEHLAQALRTEACRGDRRVVRFPALDVHFDPALRVAQVVTSLQRGGAERIAIDLHRALPQLGCRTLLVAIGPPTREAFSVPAGTVDVSGAEPSRQARLAAAVAAVQQFSADIVHGHLLNAEDVASLTRCGVPVVLTIHNAQPGWPEGLTTLRPEHAALLIACSQAAEADLRAAHVPLPVRTVWNGIDFRPYERTPERELTAADIRRRLAIPPADLVLLAIANPRPQKRLERLPAILAATAAELERRGIKRQARLVIAGEASRASPAAHGAERALHAAIAERGLEHQVQLLGAVRDVEDLLAAADVLVSASAYEGLSLVHLEALAAGIPVVATAAGGTPEIAAGNPAVRLLPLDASPEQFAPVLADVAQSPPPSGGAAAAVNFDLSRMVAGYRRLYPRAIAAAERRPRDGVWLIINNFSTGGAQSSARRLLVGLAGQGIRVRAAVLEEQEAHPTPGRQALTAAGIPVLTLPPAGTVDPAEAVALLTERLDDEPPRAVLLWNVIAEYKVLLADSLLDTPLYDVSPGEMNFESLERYFRRPRPGLPYRTPRDYGARLAGAIVKYRSEAARAGEWFGTSVEVVPNGVPLDGVPVAHAPRDRLVIGTAARLAPQKKLEELLQALRIASGRLPPYVLRIAGGAERGSEEYAAELRRLAAGLPVEWLGELADTRPFLRQLDAFVMISEPAGCPNASLEAMAVGLPVVATDVGGAGEQVRDGVTGRLVPRGNCEALAEALVKLAHDAALRARYGAAGRAHIAAGFDVRRMLADYQRILGLNGTARESHATSLVS